jgi:hypothetical protein
VTTDTTTLPDKVERTARLRWVPLSKIKVNPAAQREMKQYRVDHILANLDLDQLGNPVLNERDGSYWVIDGQHRIEALRQFGFTDETIQCWVHVGLSEQEEAKRFLLLNDTLTVDALAKYRAAITAGLPVECDIDRTVRSNGMVVSKDDVPGAIGAVNTLRRVYGRSGPVGLGRTLRIIHKSFGDSGLEAAVIDGIGLLCQRYNGELEESVAIERLSRLSAGANGLLGDAEKLRRSTGAYKSHCVAAAAVDVINRGKGGRKLPSWWKDS